MQQNKKRYLLLKLFILSLIICFNSFSTNAQLLKRIKDVLKASAENKATDKVNEKVNQGIDGILKPGTKKKNSGKNNPADSTDKSNDKGNGAGINDNTNKNSAQTDSINTYNTKDDTDPAAANASHPEEGFVSLSTSASNTFTGGSVIISGESVFYGKYNSVGLTIQGPYTEDADPKPTSGFTKLSKQIPLDKDGKFKTVWNGGGTDGLFRITVTSSDAKATKTKTVKVNSWPDMGDMADSNIQQTTKVYDKLVKRVEEVKPNVSGKDAAELDKKMAEVKDKKDAAIKMFTSINDATKKLGTMVKKGKGLPATLSANLSALNNNLSSQASDMARVDEFTNHEPSDNSICEYLVMVKEACAAFSTLTNVFSKSVGTILENITLDKAVPLGVGAGPEAQADRTGNPVDPDKEGVSKETGKIFATAAVDAKSLTSKIGVAGIAGDLVTMASDYLLRKYCGVYEGTVKHDYTVIFRNDDHQVWWKYGVEMEAAFSLRYPKDKAGRTIKMKGNIEGNATKFTFFADALEAVKDEMKGRDKFVKVIVLRDFLPPAIPFATSEHDKMGFGSVARGLATPAYFNIPVDADYDLDAEKIKLFINPALVDFSEAVENREIYMAIAVLPLIRWMEYPIFKAQQTIKGSFKEKNEFTMTGGKSPQCIDKASRHINDENAPFEIFLNTTFAIKKQ